MLAIWAAAVTNFIVFFAVYMSVKVTGGKFALLQFTF